MEVSMIDFIDPFIIRALLAGIGIAMVAGVLGCFVVWRRMAYFGDSLSHSGLLGIALGLLLGININIGIILVSSCFALLLIWLQQKKILATDTLLGILSHAALSIGLVTISLIDGVRIDIYSYLFGDILTVTTQDLWWIYGGGIIILSLLYKCWSSLMLMTIHQDLAQAEGVKVFWCNLLFMFLMTLVVAVSIRIVGILLITSLLIIPAASARQVAKSPEAMAFFAALIGGLAVIGGVILSANADTPSGPSIVVMATVIFLIVFVNAQFFSKRQ